MSTIEVNIVSAQEHIFNGNVTMVIVPGSQGELGIKPKHAPLLTSIKPGEVRLHFEQEPEKSIFVAGGYIEVQPSIVTILADTAIRAEDLDEDKIKRAQAKAEAALKGQTETLSALELQQQLAMASAQLQLLKKIRSSR